MIGQTISHYKILEMAGEGGMGVVYKALDLRLERYAALKFLPLNCRPHEKSRFLQEAKAASAIDHPNICTIYEIGETNDGQPFIAMAYCHGTELYEKLKSGPMILDEALEISIQIATGLSAIHARGIVHRDIKSSNVFVCEERTLASRMVKIIDFGLAHSGRGDEKPAEDSGSGTLPYMSPEQVRGEPVDQRTDIWSLGVILYEMLSGRLPFASKYRDATVYLILNGDPPALSTLRPDVPIELERIVMKCLEKEPAARYQNIEQLRTDLQNERESSSYWNRTVAEKKRMLTPGQSQRIWIAAASIAD